MKKTTVITTLVLIIITLIGCGGGSNDNPRQNELPISNSENWLIEKKYSNVKLLDIAGWDGLGDYEIILGENGFIAEHNDGQWQNKDISLKNLNDVEYYSSSALWAAGKNGSIYFFDGSSWIKQKTNTTSDINAIKILNLNEGWAVGNNGVILHYDGLNWTQENSGTNTNLKSVDGIRTSENGTVPQVWIVGDDGLILRRQNNGLWSSERSGITSSLNDISVTWYDSTSNLTSIYAVGDNGVILHSDGKNWSKMQASTSENLNGIRALEDDSAFAVGNNGTILFFNGQEWVPHKSPIQSNLRKLFNLPWDNYRGAIAIADDGSIISNRISKKPEATSNTTLHHIRIRNNTSSTIVLKAPKSEDFAEHNAPRWESEDRKFNLPGDNPFSLEPNSEIILSFTIYMRFRSTDEFSILYRPVDRSDYTYQQTCLNGNGKKGKCRIGDGEQHISNQQDFSWDGMQWLISPASLISTQNINPVASLAQTICDWMGIKNTSSGWGKIIKTGLTKVIQSIVSFRAGYILKNYAVSISNSTSPEE